MIHIYQIYCSVNEKYYVGQTIRPHTRWNQHKNRLYNGNHDNRYLQAIYNKYGKDSLKFELINAVETQEEANQVELHWIEFYRSYDRCINLSGDTTSVYTPSTETKAKISKTLLGNKRNLGKKHSEETIEIIRAANKGLKRSKEYLMKRSATRGFKPFKVYHPEHGVVLVEYMREFCDKYGLSSGALSNLRTRKYKSTLGWKLYEE